ncbi:VWA domain-containing protein [Sporosarcina ureae]|uniref:VWA domain-containing protein n=1 Tax=Sporosarcina ureae TaxID=1571 RepID=UPI0026EDE829|nr:VWA domain-containing protein [Sporosarcina ureae]
MKIHLKITAMFALLSIIILSSQTIKTEAAKGDASLSCEMERGRDIIFVIQDTPQMQLQDSSRDRILESTRMIDEAGSLDRFGIIGFNENITKNTSLTSNKYQVKTKINELSTSSTPTGVDASVALNKAIQELSEDKPNNEKLIIFMTVDKSINNEKIYSLADIAYEKDIQIHTISFGDKKLVDYETLEKVSAITEGNYHHSPNYSYLRNVLANLNVEITNFAGREVRSDWKLTQDVVEPRGLLLHENVSIDLNGYSLTIKDNLLMLNCSEIRAVNGAVIQAENVTQKSNSTIALNNSQLNVIDTLKQDGSIIVNGDYKRAENPEIMVNVFNQRVHGYLDLNGQKAKISSEMLQEGHVDLKGGTFHANSDLQQKGHFNVQGGTLQIDGNLIINGGPLIDDAYIENKSLNVGGGLLQVGSKEFVKETSAAGNVRQLNGQLYINHGSVKIYGDYTIVDGWLTMIKGSMDTSTPQYGEGDGDYVYVYGDFSTSSKRNHASRKYIHLGKPMNDQGHLTDGVLKIGGTFTQTGNGEDDLIYTDRMNGFKKDYSRYNFHAKGRHKVVMMNKERINIEGKGFTFNLLELHGKLQEYSMTGPVAWNKVNEVPKSANSTLSSLSINDKQVPGFTPNTMKYFRFEVPADSLPTGGAQTLKVDARAQDRNATVTVLNRVLASDGTGEVKVQVTAVDGSNSVYTVEVKVGPGSGGKVTSIELDRKEVIFIEKEGGGYNPLQIIIGYTVYPKNATNQQVNWTSTNPDVAEVNASGIVKPLRKGETSIVATTADGGLIDSASVQVLGQNDLLQGIKTLEDFVDDNDRYDKIMSGLYDLDKLGIVVPGNNIKSLQFTKSGILTSGVIEAGGRTARIEVLINGMILGTNKLSSNKFIFNRASMKVSDYVEIISYDSASNELERIGTTYPVGFEASSGMSPGYYSIKYLLLNKLEFDQILDEYSPKQLRFTAR